MSVIDLIKDQLSGELIGNLGETIGENPEKTRVAADAAIPSVLSVLASSVLSGKGVDGLLEALRTADQSGDASGLRSPASGPPSSSPSGDLLGSLLGPNLSALINVLSKFSGVGLAGVTTLLKYLGPIILKVIANQLKAKGGLTPAGLTSFFTAEKESISRALPAGLGLADLPSLSKSPVQPPLASESSSASWLLPAVAIGLIALAGLYYLSQPAEDGLPTEIPVPPASQTDPLPTPAIPEADEIQVAIPSADDVSERLTEVYTGATQSLASVTDVETAEAAVPSLQGFQSQLDTLSTIWDKIPAEAKSAVARASTEHLDEFKTLVAKVLEIPGVSEKLKPILDALIAKLSSFEA